MENSNRKPPKEKWFINKLNDIIRKVGFKKLKLHPRAYDYLMALAASADKNGNCWPLGSQIENLCGIRTDNQCKYVKILKKIGYITVKRRQDKQNRRAKMTRNYYTIHLDAILTISMGLDGDLRVDGIAVKPVPTESKRECSQKDQTVTSTVDQTVMSTVPLYKTTHKAKLPISALKDIVQQGRLDDTVIDMPIDYYFEEFWAVYPRKEKKKEARTTWMKHRLDSKSEMIIQDLRLRQVRHLPWLEGRSFIPLPTTYLNGERWNDEIIGADNEQTKPHKRTSAQESTVDAQREYFESLKREGKL